MKVLNLQGRSQSELKKLLVKVETSDADIDVKKINIENIKKAIGEISSKQEALMQFYEGAADIDDI